MTFFGYRIGRNYRPDTGTACIGTRPSPASVQSMCRRLSELTTRRSGLLPPEVVVARLNRLLTGWANYFTLGQVSPAYAAVDRQATLRRLTRPGRRTDWRFRSMADQLDDRPVFTIVMGCNGAGKSAWKRGNYDLLPERFFDQDSIAGGIGDGNSESARVRTRAIVDAEVAEAVANRLDFGTESTSSGRPGREMVDRVRNAGYRIEGIYIGTVSPEINIERIERRVRNNTGHRVDPARVPERYRYSLSNLRTRCPISGGPPRCSTSSWSSTTPTTTNEVSPAPWSNASSNAARSSTRLARWSPGAARGLRHSSSRSQTGRAAVTARPRRSPHEAGKREARASVPHPARATISLEALRRPRAVLGGSATMMPAVAPARRGEPADR